MNNLVNRSVLMVLCLFNSVFGESFNPDDLVEIVGLPFSKGQSFHVDGFNSKGQKVGWASFKNPDPIIGCPELIAWFWDEDRGFQIIASQSDLLNAYGKELRKKPFQFYKFIINEKGEVAGSVMVDQIHGSDGIYNQCPWLWWSQEEGLHLSELPSRYELLQEFTEDGFVLLQHTSRRDVLFRIVNIHLNDYDKLIEFFPGEEYMPSFAKQLKQLFSFCGHAISEPFHWHPFVREEFDCSYDILNISGRGKCSLKSKHEHRIYRWEIIMGFIISAEKLVVRVTKIESLDGLPCLFLLPWPFVVLEKDLWP